MQLMETLAAPINGESGQNAMQNAIKMAGTGRPSGAKRRGQANGDRLSRHAHHAENVWVLALQEAQ